MHLAKCPRHYNNYIYVVVDINDDASMDEICVAYVDDEHYDNHGYDYNTDDDHDNDNDIYDDISMIYR